MDYQAIEFGQASLNYPIETEGTDIVTEIMDGEKIKGKNRHRQRVRHIKRVIDGSITATSLDFRSQFFRGRGKN